MNNKYAVLNICFRFMDDTMLGIEPIGRSEAKNYACNADKRKPILT